MKITSGQLFRSWPALLVLSRAGLNIRTAFELRDWMKQVENRFFEIRALWSEIAEKVDSKNAQSIKLANEQIAELLAQDMDVPDLAISRQALLDSNFDGISAVQLDALNWLIQEKDEN